MFTRITTRWLVRLDKVVFGVFLRAPRFINVRLMLEKRVLDVVRWLDTRFGK